ncbi:MAG TPA: HPP family protein [Thermoanaerobaculia bacterium]|nr:HPP family protein [Thermoanaerobaculia bacterium]
MTEKKSLEPGRQARLSIRDRLSLRDELVLALVPTVMVLIVFAVVEEVSNQRLLFASLASSAFLIYLDPEHGTNRVRTLAASQIAAAVVGFAGFELIGPSYTAGALAMVATTLFMIVFDVVHPPAAATALAFAFRTGDERNLVLFALAVGLVVALVIVQAATLAILARLRR